MRPVAYPSGMRVVYGTSAHQRVAARRRSDHGRGEAGAHELDELLLVAGEAGQGADRGARPLDVARITQVDQLEHPVHGLADRRRRAVAGDQRLVVGGDHRRRERDVALVARGRE